MAASFPCETPPIGMILIQPKLRGSDCLIGAREMLLDCADADAEFAGDHALRLPVDPEAAKDDSRPFRQAVQNPLQDRELLPRDELGLDRRLIVDLSAAAMHACPILLATLAPAGGTAMQQEVIVGHLVEIGARLRDGSGALGQQLDVHVLENVLRFVGRGPASLEKARQSRAQFREQWNEAAAIQHFMRTFGFRQR